MACCHRANVCGSREDGGADGSGQWLWYIVLCYIRRSPPTHAVADGMDTQASSDAAADVKTLRSAAGHCRSLPVLLLVLPPRWVLMLTCLLCYSTICRCSRVSCAIAPVVCHESNRPMSRAQCREPNVTRANSRQLHQNTGKGWKRGGNKS